MEGELVLKEEKMYVPKDKELRTEIIQLYHNILVARHGGKIGSGRRMINKLIRTNTWRE